MLNNWWLVLVLGTALLVVSWAALVPGFFRVHDYVHATRCSEAWRGLSEGQLPLRWSQHLGYGYGMPLFEFYAPLPYYLCGVAWGVGVPMEAVMPLLWIVPSLIMVVGGYALGQRLWQNQLASVVLSVLMVLAPYRAVNLYVRGAVSEVWGLAFVPLVLWAGLGWLQRKRVNGLWLVLAMSAVMLSHNLTALMVLPAALVWLTIWGVREYGWRRGPEVLVRLGAAAVMSVGLSLFYVLPAMVEKDLTRINSILSGYFHYSQHFLYLRQLIQTRWGYGGSEWGPGDGISFFLGYGVWLGVVLAGVVGLWVLVKAVKGRKFGELVFPGITLLLALLSLYMSLQRSLWVWEVAPTLAIIQFPWRWLGATGVWLSILVGWAVARTQYEAKVRKPAGVAVAVVLLIALTTSLTYFKPETWADRFEDFYYTDTDLIERQMSQILPDYIPLALGDVKKPPEQKFWVALGLDKYVETVVDRGHQKLYKTSVSQPTLVTLALADMPGWQVEIDGKVAEKRDGVVGGTVAFEAPAGEHFVSVTYGQTPLLLYSWVVSVLCTLLLAGWYLRLELRDRKSISHA
jgi:hypothetical protein